MKDELLIILFVVVMLTILFFIAVEQIKIRADKKQKDIDEYIHPKKRANAPEVAIPYIYINKDIIVDELNNKNYDILATSIKLSDNPDANYGLHFLNSINSEIKNDPKFVKALRKATKSKDNINVKLLLDATTEKRQYDWDSYDFIYKFYLVMLMKDDTIKTKFIDTRYSKTYEK